MATQLKVFRIKITNTLYDGTKWRCSKIITALEPRHGHLNPPIDPSVIGREFDVVDALSLTELMVNMDGERRRVLTAYRDPVTDQPVVPVLTQHGDLVGQIVTGAPSPILVHYRAVIEEVNESIRIVEEPSNAYVMHLAGAVHLAANWQMRVVDHKGVEHQSGWHRVSPLLHNRNGAFNWWKKRYLTLPLVLRMPMRIDKCQNDIVFGG